LIRYLAALITATLGGLAGIWLVLAPAALDYPGRGVYTSMPSRVSLYTGAGLCAVAVLTAVCWAVAWRGRLRADGVLPGARAAAVVPPEEATTGPLAPVPAAVPVRLEDDSLQALLAPLVAALTRDEEAADTEPDHAAGRSDSAGGCGDARPGGRGGRGGHGGAAWDGARPGDALPSEAARGGAALGGVAPGPGDEPVPAGAPGARTPAGWSAGEGAGAAAGPARAATPFGEAPRPPLPRRRPPRRTEAFGDDDAEETW